MTLGKNTAENDTENDSGPVQSITPPPNFLVSHQTPIEGFQNYLLEHGQARLEWLGKAIQNDHGIISFHFISRRQKALKCLEPLLLSRFKMTSHIGTSNY